jgi:RHS repeat-associated protein
MLLHTKKILSFLLFIVFVFTTWGFTNVFANKSINKETKKEYDLKQKFKWDKLNKVKDSIKWKDNYKVVIKSDKTLKELKDTYNLLDSNVKIKKIWKDIFQLKISKNSSLATSLSSIDNWILPETLWSEKLLEPEIFETYDTTYLSWEETQNLWYLNKVWADTFQESLKIKQKIKVWVLDTWIDSSQNDLKDNYDSGLSYNFINETNNSSDDNWHGTQVAWVIWAEVNWKWIYWVNSNSDLVSLKVLDNNWLWTSYDVLEAIDYTINNNIKVINISFWWAWDPSTSEVCKAITDAKNAWVITVVSAWNTNSDVSNIIPAWCSDAIVVWSTDQNNNKSSYSNYWNQVDIYAPWENIYTTNLNNTYVLKNWTSFSAPIVAWLVSKELAYNSTLTYDEILNNIKTNYNLATSFDNNSNVVTNTWSLTSSWITSSWTTIIPQIDYSKLKYYSWSFVYDWKKYWNSLYDNSYWFDKLNLKNIQIYTYDEYLKLVQSTKKDFSAMSIPTDWLVWRWNFNWNALDTSWNGNNGTPFNVTWVDSWIWDWKQVSLFTQWFNSWDQYVSSALNPTSEDITISFFSKTNALNGQWYMLPITHESVWIIDFRITFWDSPWNYNDVSFRQYNWAWLTAIGSNVLKRDWTWQFWTFTRKKIWDVYYLNIYLDNILVWNTYWNTTKWTPNSWISVWSSLGWGGYNWNIKNIKVYNRALSTSEIQQLYLDWTNTVDNNTPTNSINFLNSSMFLNTSSTCDSKDTKSPIYLNIQALKSMSNTEKADTGNKWDPVNLATWEFWYDNTFMSIPGNKIPYELKLSYKNQLYYNWPAWINWDHNYNKYLSEETNENVLLYNWELGVFRFIKNWSTFDYNPWLKATLTQTNWLYTINYDSWDKYYFNSDKRLSKLEDIYSNSLNFSYSGWLLSQVTDTIWRDINYNYYDHNRLKEVVDFNGKKVEFSYFDGTTNSWSIYDLKEIKVNNWTWSVKTIKYEYTTGGDDESKHNITKLIDSKWQTYVSNTYDNDRVGTQKYWTGTITYSYTLSGSSVTQNTVTDRLWNTTQYKYDSNWNNFQTNYYTSSWNIDYYYTYNSLGYLETEKRPAWNGYKYSYDSKWNLIEKRLKADLTQADSSNDLVTTYTYNSQNKLLTQTIENWTTITNSYSSSWNLTQSITSWLKTSTWATYQTTKTFSYNTLWLLTQSTDTRWTIVNYSYSWWLLTSITTWTGTNARVQDISYNSYGIPTSKTDARWNTINFEITQFNQVWTWITSEWIKTSYEYDENNNKTKETKYFTGWTQTTTYTYDLLDNPIQIISDYDTSKQVITTLKYDNNSNLIEKKVWSWATIKYSYNEFVKLTQEKIVVDSNDTSKDIITSYEYDNNWNLIKKTDPKWNITNYVYDDYDRLVKEINPKWDYSSITYNSDNTISQLQKYSSWNTLLSKLSYTYNWLWKVLKEITYKDPINNTWAITQTNDYDNNGNLVSKIDWKWNQTIYAYDEFNNLIETTDSLWNKIVSEYDKNNNITQKQIVQSNNKVTTTNYNYDEDNRLLSETNNLNKTKTYEYNNLNQAISIEDENWNTTSYTYDYRGKAKTKSQTNSWSTITTSYTYDERWNNTSIEDQNWNTTTYVYDNLNRLITTIYPDDKEINYSYDKNSNLLSQLDPNGTNTTNTYDTTNYLTARTIQTWTGVIWITNENYSYDELCRLIEANDTNNHKLNFAYDSLNRLLQENQSGSLVNYTYDDNNNLLSITNPNNKTTSYTYDELNRLTNISQSWTTIATYSYTWVLNDKITYWNNKEIISTFDSLNRLNSLNNWVKNYTYTYDDVSNITSDNEKNYSYDDIYRVTQVNNTQSGTLLERFNYDSAGNRTNDLNNSYTNNNLNQYTSVIASGATQSTLTYDNNWNLINDWTKTYEYDYKNRLVKVTSWSWVIAEFKYDVLGRRYEKRAGTTTTNYIYSNENLLSEYKTVNWQTLKKEYVNWLWIDNILAVEQEEPDLTIQEREELSFCNANVLVKSGEFVKYGWQLIVDRCNNLVSSGSVIVENRYYFAKNHLWSVDAITDNSWTIVTTYDYDSYWNFTQSWYDIWNSRLFTGREYDKEIGLYYNRARYYNPELGRFISRDPIGQVDDVNLYGYVGENPVMWVDPSWNVKELLINSFYDTSTFIGLNSTWIWWEWVWLNVSLYMLAKFMYWNWSSDYYWNNHWISQKLMKTDFYKSTKQKAINETIKNWKYEKSDKWDLTHDLSTDFPTSFWTVDWNITAKVVEDWKIQTNFNIKDTYIFNDNYSDWAPIDNPFNKMWKYYQDRWYWTPFQWELNITETFNY